MTTTSTPAPSAHDTGTRSVAHFDAAEWLTTFEANGGTIFFDECGKPALGFYAHRNPDECQAKARAMIADITDAQIDAVAEQRHAAAANFDPAAWRIEFTQAGGSVYAWDGSAWTGMPDQDDDRALRMRRRLLPEEVAKLGCFLRRHFGIGEAA
jgi:hypothetical protein